MKKVFVAKKCYFYHKKPVLWGQIPEHTCVNGSSVLIPCDKSNTTNCENVMHHTYASDFDLLCDRHYLYPYVQSTVMWGGLFGEITFGYLQLGDDIKRPVGKVHIWHYTALIAIKL